MLVLSRRVGQKIIIPELGIEITPLQTRSDAVRIGIAADPNIQIFREEIWDRIKQVQPELADKLNQRCETFIGNMPERAEK